MTKPENNKLNKLVTESRRAREQRDLDYREQALNMYPHICGRCAREFNRENLNELTVHHRDHNHSNNPVDGSNWELLCVYCHDNEHQRQLEAEQDSTSNGSDTRATSTSNPFADLRSMMKNKK